VTDISTCLQQQFDLIEAIIVVCRAKTIESFAVVGIDIERIVRVEQSTAFEQRVIDYFDFLDAFLSEREAQKPAFLARERQTTFRIKGE